MKRIALVIATIVLVACKEKKTTSIVQKEGVETSEAIELEVYDFRGLEKMLSTQSDTTYVVNFWATWCKPCVKELPYFEQLRSNYKEKNVELLLVSLDFPAKYESKLKPFIKEHNLQSNVVALDDPDMNTWIPKVDENWSGAIPATLIFNKTERKFFEKSFTYNELETELKPFLN
ncbi:TlpA family protein disulfide reductase [Mangrovimonas spongiae]|uniref:Redoxin domain-containing protein n=1 Tax=Mangrovimonas spongiae TaxID=2494697 RepID=A0A428JYC8_9FLAO|nr:TlpA family protein disulfide reductase [Mangrovimonas spongiae]RSK39151.1 redoxin domain-containing protein [Mangrovimonas spongiae]